MLGDGETGFLVEPGNRHDLADSVLSLLADGDKAAAFGRASTQRASTSYSLDLFVKKYLAVYSSAVSNRP